MSVSRLSLDQLDEAQLRERVEQLETALTSRIVIEQAKGVLAERLKLSIDESFALLRYAARSSRLKIHDLAHEVVEEACTPMAVVVALPRQQRLRAAWMIELAQAQRETIADLGRSLDAYARRRADDRAEATAAASFLP